MATDEAVEPPAAVYVRPRWISARLAEWVEECNTIMRAHGVVCGAARYPQRYQAKWRAQKLVRLMVELRMYDREQLKYHTEAREGGWVWTVEYLGGRHARRDADS